MVVKVRDAAVGAVVAGVPGSPGSDVEFQEDFLHSFLVGRLQYTKAINLHNFNI